MCSPDSEIDGHEDTKSDETDQSHAAPIRFVLSWLNIGSGGSMSDGPRFIIMNRVGWADGFRTWGLGLRIGDWGTGTRNQEPNKNPGSGWNFSGRRRSLPRPAHRPRARQESSIVCRRDSSLVAVPDLRPAVTHFHIFRNIDMRVAGRRGTVERMRPRVGSL